MPRAVIIGATCAVLAVVAYFALRDRGDDRAAPKPSASSASPNASTTPTSASTSGASTTGSAITAPIPPPEARVDLTDAFTASRFEDVHTLCGSRATAAAHPFECTVAACKTNSAADAQRYFVGVAEADRPKVEAECEAAHVHVDPEGGPRRRVRFHIVHGKRVIDD